LYLGPPIHGECGASYRYSENLPVDTGYKPFVVEIKIHGGAGEVRPGANVIKLFCP
jgi:hypothetical protein